MTNHLTWRDVRNYLNELDDKALDETACVWLNDMVWMIDECGTAGLWPIDFIGMSIINDRPIITIDDCEDENEEDEEV